MPIFCGLCSYATWWCVFIIKGFFEQIEQRRQKAQQKELQLQEQQQQAMKHDSLHESTREKELKINVPS